MAWTHYVSIGIYTTSAHSEYTTFCVSIENETMNKYKRGKGLHYNHVDTICILYTSSNAKEYVMSMYMDNGGNNQLYHVIATMGIIYHYCRTYIHIIKQICE